MTAAVVSEGCSAKRPRNKVLNAREGGRCRQVTRLRLMLRLR